MPGQRVRWCTAAEGVETDSKSALLLSEVCVVNQGKAAVSSSASKHRMPTVTVQVGQAGNQLGYAWWSVLRRQQKQLGDGPLIREYFRPSGSSREANYASSVDVPRVISVDSESKVISDCCHDLAPHQLQILGHGGCGNNW